MVSAADLSDLHKNLKEYRKITTQEPLSDCCLTAESTASRRLQTKSPVTPRVYFVTLSVLSVIFIPPATGFRIFRCHHDRATGKRDAAA
jgi:hypothetical protein